MCAGTGGIHVVQFFGKEVVCYLYCLWGVVHSFSNLSIDMSIFLHISEVVLFYYLFRYDIECQEDIFIPFHGGYQIIIIDVSAHEAHLWS